MSHPAYSWTSLGRGGVEVEASARMEAMELARALAAQTIVVEHDAAVDELGERIRAIADTMWPQSPLSGYGLHSSLGAYLVAKVAIGWAPSGMIGLRRDPVDRDALIEDLVEQGVERPFALAIAGDWTQVEPGFMPDPTGLDVSRIAGLVECSLSKRERARALSQLAYSARCLSRLAATARVLSALRHVLPVLPPESIGRSASVGFAALALGRSDRVLQLLGERPQTLAERTIAELAAAITALERGATPIFDDTGAILTPPAASAPKPEVDTDDLEAQKDQDDVLEIVEERIDTGARASNGTGSLLPVTNGSSRTPRPARWSAAEGAIDPLDHVALAEWRRRFDDQLALFAQRGTLLGLDAAPPLATANVPPIPPDERFASVHLARTAGEANADTQDRTERIPVAVLMSLEALKSTETVFDAVFPPVRGAIRAIVEAANGRAPSDEAIANAGDLAWVLMRAKALANVVTGELETAVASVSGLPETVAPEGRWAADRLKRFGGRRIVRAESREARAAAAGLAMDLAHQLGRTIAGTASTERIG